MASHPLWVILDLLICNHELTVGMWPNSLAWPLRHLLGPKSMTWQAIALAECLMQHVDIATSMFGRTIISGLDPNNPRYPSLRSKLSNPSQYGRDVKMGVARPLTIMPRHNRCDIMSKISGWYMCGSMNWNGMCGGLMWFWLCLELREDFERHQALFESHPIVITVKQESLRYFLVYICSAVWGWLHKGSLQKAETCWSFWRTQLVQISLNPTVKSQY